MRFATVKGFFTRFCVCVSFRDCVVHYRPIITIASKHTAHMSIWVMEQTKPGCYPLVYGVVSKIALHKKDVVRMEVLSSGGNDEGNSSG